VKETIEKLAKNAQAASKKLAVMTSTQKNRALEEIGKSLIANKDRILAVNEKEVRQVAEQGRGQAFLDRLKLTEKTLNAMVEGLHNIASLPDPVGKILAQWTRPNGLEITRISIPLGVIGVIYESRPNVTIDAAALCLKAGNAAILRGGSESFASSQVLAECIQQGLNFANLPSDCVQLLPTADRTAMDELLKMDKYIDVIVPRGGQNLINYVSQNSKIPVFKHLAGNCHTYIQASVKLEMAKAVLLNAKMRRTGICGATETLLIDRNAIDSLLPDLIEALTSAGCEIRGDEMVKLKFPQVKAAIDSDWDTEYLDAIIAIKVVSGIDEAIQHIATHGTQHTEAIITEDIDDAEKFLKEVDSAIVMHNTSTQFADGGEFGMGAEIGIATGKLHARGPVGVEQLTTFKYLVRGSGQTRL
jgi:glutamate-5-semialdehyde dehydrogenase